MDAKDAKDAKSAQSKLSANRAHCILAGVFFLQGDGCMPNASTRQFQGEDQALAGPYMRPEKP